MENVSYLCIVTCEVTIHRQLDAQISRRMLAPYTERLGFLLIPMSEEIWKPVLGYEGLYEVSSLGRVRRVECLIVYKDGRKRLWPRKNIKVRIWKRKGYDYLSPIVCLSKDSKVKTRKVAHLVCEAFHGPRPIGYVCMHLNGNPEDNRPENLAWGTVYENSNEPIRRRKLSEVAKGRGALYWKTGKFDSQLRPCLQYSLSGELIKEYRCIRDAERKTGIDHITISRACRGILKTSGGYIWKYKEQ